MTSVEPSKKANPAATGVFSVRAGLGSGRGWVPGNDPFLQSLSAASHQHPLATPSVTMPLCAAQRGPPHPPPARPHVRCCSVVLSPHSWSISLSTPPTTLEPLCFFPHSAGTRRPFFGHTMQIVPEDKRERETDRGCGEGGQLGGTMKQLAGLQQFISPDISYLIARQAR